MKFVQCLHNSTEAFRVWFKVVSNDFSEELTYKKKQYPRDMPNCIMRVPWCQPFFDGIKKWPSNFIFIFRFSSAL